MATASFDGRYPSKNMALACRRQIRGRCAFSVGCRTERHAFRAYLGRHQSLRSRPKSHENELPRPQLGQTEAAQGLHVHENVGRALATGEETETAQPVEPLHLRPLERAGRRHGDVGARRRHLRRMHRRRFVHGENAERLQATRALQHLDHDACTLVGDLESVAAQTGHVQEDVGHPVVGNDEAVTLGHIEPLDGAGQFDDARGLVTDLATGTAGDTQTAAGPLRSNSVRGHDAPTPPLQSRRFLRALRILAVSEDSIRRQTRKSKMHSRAKRGGCLCTSLSYLPNQWAMKGDSTVPMSSRTTRSAISSNSVASRLTITKRAPLRLASKGNPAAGHTTSEDPTARKRSQASVSCSARRISRSGIAWPKETVAVLIWPPQSPQSGARSLPSMNCRRTQASS